MPSDYDDRRRESIGYLNRMQDRSDFEQTLRDRSSAVYDGIREGNEIKARSVLGLAPSPTGSSASSSRSLPETDRPPTAGEQFREHCGKLLYCLEWTDVFPASLLEQWRELILALDVEQPTKSLRLLAVFSESYEQAKNRFKPAMLEVSRSMQFEYQVPRIGREIDWLIRILEHVLAYTGQSLSR